MRRREFSTLLGGAAATWPLAVRAQQRPGKLAKIGYLGSSTVLAQSQWTAAFLQRLRELGWIEGRNLHADYRWGGTDINLLQRLAKEIVAAKPDVIFSSSSSPTTIAHCGLPIETCWNAHSRPPALRLPRPSSPPEGKSLDAVEALPMSTAQVSSLVIVGTIDPATVLIAKVSSSVHPCRRR